MPAGVDQREVHGGGRGELVVTIPEPQEPDRPPGRADGEDSGPPAPAAVRAEVWCEVERRRHQTPVAYPYAHSCATSDSLFGHRSC